MNFKLGGNRVEPINHADDFFAKPELLNQSIIGSHMPTKCSAGCLGLRIPDPPQYAAPAICSISKNGSIAAVGGKDVELFLWDTNTGELLTIIRGHDVCWTSSYANDFYVTVQEDSKVITWDQDLHTQRALLGQPDEPVVCCAVSLDDCYVVVGGARGGVYAYASEGNEVHHFAGGHIGPVQTVMCYAMEDGSHTIISCGANDQTIVIWDLTSGERRLSVPVTELEHAKNLRYYIKGGTDVLVWCTDAVPFPNLVFVNTVNQTKSSVYAHDGLVRHAVFSKEGSSIISCGSDSKIVVWDAATMEARMTLLGHIGVVLCCSINNEGTRIVSSGEDATVRVWSAEDGRQLQRMEAQDEPVKFCTFAKKGSKILTCDASGRAYVWSSLSEVVLNLVRRYADTISAISLSNDGKLLLSGTNNGRVMLWDVDRRRNIWEFSHHTGRVESVSFNSVKDLAASAGADGRVSVINIETGKQANSFLGHDEPILSIAFSPDDERIGGVSADGKLLIYMANSSSRKAKLVLHSSIARVTSFVWSPNSKLVAGCGSDGCVLVWNAVSGTVFSVLEGSSAATCCAFDYIGKLVAVGTHMGSTVLYNLETTELLSELRYNAGPVREVVFNQETSRLTTICNRQAIIWDVATSKKKRTFDFIVDKSGDFQSNPLNPYRTAVAHSGTVLFDPESEALIYDMVSIEDSLISSYYFQDTRMISSGTQVHKRFAVWSATGNSLPDKFHTTHDAVTSCHFSYDDRLVVMGTQDGNIVVYDVSHNETVEVIAAHQNGACRCVRLSPDNNEVLSCGSDAKVILWDWRNRQALRIYNGHFVSVSCCDLAFQGNLVVSGDNHGMISIFDKLTGVSVQSIPLAHAKSVLSVSMSADGSTVASVGSDDKVSIWGVEDGLELVSLTAAIESRPLYCIFSHDGNKLAVTESNGNIMVWSAVAGCQWYMIMGAHKGRVTSCSWSFDCRRFVTVGTDSVLAVWDSESGAPLLKFDIGTGPLTTCAVSPMGVYVAAGSSSGTLSVCSIPLSSKAIPEPSFLYHWLSAREAKLAAQLFNKLAYTYPTLANVQDAQGWSLVHHTVTRGNSYVAGLILDSLPENYGSLGLTSAVPYTIQTRVKFNDEGIDYSMPMGESLEHRGSGEYADGRGINTHMLHSSSGSSSRGSIGTTNQSGASTGARRPAVAKPRQAGILSGHPSQRFLPRASRLRPGPIAESNVRNDSSGGGAGDGPRLAHMRNRPPPLEVARLDVGAVPSVGGADRLFVHPLRYIGDSQIHVAGSPIAEAKQSNEQHAGFLGSILRVASTTLAGMRNGRGSPTRRLKKSGGEAGSFSGSANDDAAEFFEAQKSTKSFSQRIRKVAVQLFTEKLENPVEEIIMNNSLALSLNSQSSECVRVILDAAANNMVSWGSYHCVTDMMPSLAVRYPFMCFQFLASLEMLPLGELEVPVNAMKDLDSGVIRTAPIFTNVKNLWQSHFKDREVKSGPQPYAHVKASMVRLPFSCAVGKESLLQTLVESDVPVQAYSTSTVQAVIKHKWRLYGKQRLGLRTAIYVCYTFLFTVWAAMYALETVNEEVQSLSLYWSHSATAKAHVIITGYLFLQALWYGWAEAAQLLASGPLQYLRSVWNFIDMVGIGLMVVVMSMHIARCSMQSGGALAPLIAAEVLLVYVKLAFYALVFEPTGPVFHMALQIAWEVRMWFVLLFLTLSAFGTALMVMYDAIISSTERQYKDYGYSLLTVWRMVLFQFDINDLIVSSGAWHVICLIIFCLFMAVVHILLFNMLIALMRDEFIKIRITEVDVFLRGRARLIVEVENLMSKAKLDYYAMMPPYVHMLTSTQRKVVQKSTNVEGRLERIEGMLNGLAQGDGRRVGLALGHGRGLRFTQGDTAMPGAGDAYGAVRAPPGLGEGGVMSFSHGDAGVDGDMGDDQIGGLRGQLQQVMLQLGDFAYTNSTRSSQDPTLVRQVERLQRSVSKQDARMEGMVVVLRDIEALLRNQQPFVIDLVAPRKSGGGALTEAELEKEVKRLLGKKGEEEVL